MPTYANLFNWKGVYRFEYGSFSDLSLSGKTKGRKYALHHLVLRPTLILRDGVSVQGRFHILNCDKDHCVNKNNQLGQFLGSGSGGGSFFDSNLLSQTQNSGLLQVGDLYATFSHRYGILRVGRIPLHFGLGITHNSGYSEFDHWYDTRDMISYETHFGNLSVFFGYSKFSEGKSSEADDLSERNFKVFYHSYEKGIETGFYYQSRTGSAQANDLPTGSIGESRSDQGVSSKLWNLYAKKKLKRFEWAVEGAFHRGSSGLLAGTQIVNFKSFAVIGDMKFIPRKHSLFTYLLKGGVVSGDDPSTENLYEGYFLDRNYNVAYILFNQPLGEGDALGTDLFYPKTEEGQSRRTEFLEGETLTNAYFLAPSVQFRWKQNWSLQSTFVAAFARRELLNRGSTLGYELDVSLTYQPVASFKWIFEGAYLFSGSALGGKNNTWGMGTRLAMSF